MCTYIGIASCSQTESIKAGRHCTTAYKIITENRAELICSAVALDEMFSLELLVHFPHPDVECAQRKMMSVAMMSYWVFYLIIPISTYSGGILTHTRISCSSPHFIPGSRTIDSHDFRLSLPLVSIFFFVMYPVNPSSDSSSSARLGWHSET